VALAFFAHGMDNASPRRKRGRRRRRRRRQ
jgi:hypothetical protein